MAHGLASYPGTTQELAVGQADLLHTGPGEEAQGSLGTSVWGWQEGCCLLALLQDFLAASGWLGLEAGS